MKYSSLGIALSLFMHVGIAQVSDPFPVWCDQANAVVVGSIHPSITASTTSISITVARSIKGPFPPNASITVTWNGRDQRQPGVFDGYFAVWFLSQTPTGTWTILPIGGRGAPLFISGLRVPVAAPPRVVGSAPTCSEQVVSEAVQAARHMSESRDYSRAAVHLIGAQVYSEVTSLQGDFTLSASPDERTLAAASRAVKHDPAALAQIVRELPNVQNPEVMSLVASIINGWSTGDPAAVLALGMAATRANPLGVDALMRIHSIEAVPFLATLLASKDAAIQKTAVVGLSLFIKNVPLLTPDLMIKMEQLRPRAPGVYADPAITPYIVRVPSDIAAGRESEYAQAWQQWWQRMSPKISPAN